MQTEIVKEYKIPNAIILTTRIEINPERWLELRKEGYLDSQILKDFSDALRYSINRIELDVRTKGLLADSIDLSTENMQLV